MSQRRGLSGPADFETSKKVRALHTSDITHGEKFNDCLDIKLSEQIKSLHERH